MRVGVLGAGATGARVARQLIATETVDEVVIRDASRERLASVVRSLGQGAIADPAPLDSSVDADVIVLAMNPGAHATYAARAVAEGKSVVSVADSLGDVRALLTLDRLARYHGQSVLVGTGFAPGLTCLMTRVLADTFDDVDEIHVAKAGTGGPACARVHHAALGATAIDWRDGRWARKPGGSGRELCWFPGPVAARDCYRAALPDPILLQPAFPSASRITSRMSATRRDRLTAHLPMLRPPHPEGGTGAVRVEVRGRIDGRHVVRILGAAERPAVAAATVTAVTTQWVLQRRIVRCGADGLARMVDAAAMVDVLRERNLCVEVFDGVARTVGSA